MSDPKSPLIISCPPEVLTLVQNFHEHADAYKSGKYNETQLRQQFLNPMFEALGWDLANKSNTAEAYKDVVHEDAIKIGQETKAPDYCFRIGGTRKFFLEAKKPSVYIKEEIAPAFQLRRYAWSAKLPLSILCDFEEFAVYDTRIKPDKNDKASTARILYLTYKDYSEKWHEIASVFSKEAVLKGSFDKYAESTRLKKGTATVDDAFLTEIEDWRGLLARNIAIRNPDLSQRELNFAVQRTIDRIVFLRICEDRGIENYGRLQALQNGTNSYRRLVQLFSQADDRYNSGLFHFQKEKGRHEEPDTLTTKIEIDDKPLKEIIKRLYYPESPYEFSVLSADILGQVYEQFLGKVIRLTAGHQAKVEEKPEVRKAGGVYYTPKYIVDYIVKNTVGRLLGVGDRGSGGGNGDTNIQGSGSLAGSDELNGRGISSDENVSEGRNLWIDQPNSAGSSFNTGQHSGGSQPEIKKGISSSRIYSAGITGGAGNTFADSPQAGVSAKAGLGQSVGNNPTSWTVDQRSASLSPTPDPRQLTPKEASKLKILDPACGSGSFLLGAYQYLLDWHRDWYAENDPKKWVTGKNPPLYQAQGGDYRLTTAERKRILLNNIYGVDIDSQAVEVTKLSLLLKVLEGENSQTLQSTFIHERALPDLGDNIKCGNSLIGPDFYQQQTMLDDEERYRVNVFDWKKEFTHIFSLSPREGEGRGEGGFDAVIGNPPYGATYGEKEANYFQNRYKVFSGVKDVYTCFIDRSLSLLNKNGRHSFIVPSAWLGGPDYKRLRELLLPYQIESIILLPFDVFRDAYVDTTVFVISKQTAKSGHAVHTHVYPKKEKLVVIDLTSNNYKAIPQSEWEGTEDKKFILDLGTVHLLDKIRRQTPFTFADAMEIKRGVLFDKAMLTKKKTGANSYRYFEGDVYRYQLNLVAEQWIEFNDKMKERPREIIWFEGPRILLRRLVNRRQRMMASFAIDAFITNKNLYSILAKDSSLNIAAVLGVMNSRLISYLYINQVTQATKDDFPQVTIKDVLSLPFPPLSRDKTSHDNMVSFVEQMISFNKQLPDAKTDHEKTALQRQIDATDQQIDQLVYELYGLTEEEVKIVECDHK